MKFPDIKYNRYTFSNGVGLISNDMTKVVIAAPHRGYARPLTYGFQVRLGRAKGAMYY